MTIERAFIDTNLFLYYLTNDIPKKADHVETLLQDAALGKIVLVTTSLVIAEIVWTLTSFYGLSREQIHDRVLAILNTPGLEITESDLLIEAVTNAGWETRPRPIDKLKALPLEIFNKRNSSVEGCKMFYFWLVVSCKA
jgi:predicted nucleic acid-binding protein